MATVSIILPTKDRQSLTIEAIRSVINQTFTDWELIIVDDGDCFYNPCNDDPRIRQIRTVQPGRGAAIARNLGVQEARTSLYTAFLDSDDRWDPEYLEQQVTLLDANPDACLSYSTYIELAGDQKTVRKHFPKDSSNLLASMFLDNWIHSASTVVVRSRYARRFSFYGGFKVVHDRDFYLHLLNENGSFVHLNPSDRPPLVTKRWVRDSLVGQQDCAVWRQEGLRLIETWADHPDLRQYQELAVNLFEAKVQAARPFFARVTQSGSPGRTSDPG
jgi:glycosyltransferase involved in cell wall biosynthesis